MRWRMAIPLVVVGLILACTFLLTGSARKHISSQQPHQAVAVKDHAALTTSPLKSSLLVTRIRSIEVAEPDLEKVTSLRRILANSDPRARLMLESSLSSIRSHKFLEARLALQILIKTYPDDQAVALAHWALALGYYREGGLENLRIAADQFSKFSHLYESDKNLEELVQAAQLDVAVIQIELMCLSASEKGWPIAEFATYDTGAMPAGTLALSELDTMMTADNAILNLQMFLSQWPDSPYAPAARASLEQVQEFLAGRR